MSTGWIIGLIVLVLAIIVSNLLLLKQSAKFGIKPQDANQPQDANKKQEDKITEQKDSQDK